MPSSIPTAEAIHYSHKRAFGRTNGPTTFAQHAETCDACAFVESVKKVACTETLNGEPCTKKGAHEWHKLANRVEWQDWKPESFEEFVGRRAARVTK